ncbi:hypothetical protein ACH4PU_14675 [Streptomyces sp. NPDC021100]|uniref:hypothetical protein n=1 Tax=Streptomyces sp. NPDC021100 TaxID=3365114 RepID=UPI0037B78D19
MSTREFAAATLAAVVVGGLAVAALSIARRQTRITRDAVEAGRREGYRLGLEHASRGLLLTPPTTGGGDGSTV